MITFSREKKLNLTYLLRTWYYFCPRKTFSRPTKSLAFVFEDCFFYSQNEFHIDVKIAGGKVHLSNYLIEKF